MNKMYILSEGFYDRAEKHVGLLVQGNQKKKASLTAGFFLLIIVNLYAASGSGWHCQPNKSKKRIIDNRLRFKMLPKLLKRKVYFIFHSR